ncbi:MAG: bifunctional (p)ppGpp synthetase/guanosine-3',5'-bis(diphosphate) 3'-pyrophosphohydrolase [Candidatus Taylorbacteria bacterium]|nr:bifunctional (p)ppGpp synthetase/guanosine-3',5'-bis(diphosphate) 3'-pyrophosphohydrolase [Candidatus Taylorbacteria bacterium]
MPTVHDLIIQIKSPSVEDIALISKAYSFAEEAHRNQWRSTGEPYFIHIFETAKTLAELGMGAITISAGLLHDSIEDVNISPEVIEKEFGSEVRFLVEGVTKLGKLHYSGAERYTENLRKLFVAMSKDVRVLIIKLSDRLQNMQTIGSLPVEKRNRIALETLEIFAPLAYRLGIRKINRELEDLAFPFVFPEDYIRVKSLLKVKHIETSHHLEKFHKTVKRELAREGIIEIQTGYRFKGLFSLRRKLIRKNWDIDKIYDISALRIVVPTISDCYRVLGVIHSVWRPLPGRIKDYIAFPKPDNYRGVHTTIFTGDGSIIEMQIRTEEMHKKTEYGMHFEYKEKSNSSKVNFSKILWVKKFFPSFVLRNKDVKNIEDPTDKVVPTWIRELGEYNKEAKGNQSLVDELKADFFGDRVFVFTPKGDVIDLPKGANSIDFAYSVHSELGNKLSGSKINGKLTSIDTELENGDIVEIISRPNSHPTQKWYDLAKTALAKKQIRTALGTEHKYLEPSQHN